MRLVDVCGLELSAELVRPDRQLAGQVSGQLALPAGERIAALLDQDAAQDMGTLMAELAAWGSPRMVVIGAAGCALRGGAIMPSGRVLELVAEDPLAFALAAAERGWPAGEVRAEFGELHRRRPYEPPGHGWGVELIEHPAGIGFEAMYRDAAVLPGVPGLPVASARDLLGISMASPWPQDRVHRAELAHIVAAVRGR